MEQEKLTPEQLLEVNARVKDIVETFRIALCNSAVFDYNNYWAQGLGGNEPMSKACKYVYDTKSRIVEMLDKELSLTSAKDEHLYYEEKSKAKQKIIDSLLGFVKPYLRGRSDEHNVTERIVNLTEFAIESGERLNDITNRKNFPSERFLLAQSFGRNEWHDKLV